MHRILRHISSACLALALVSGSAGATANNTYLTLGPFQDAKTSEVTGLLNSEGVSFATRSHQARESLGFIVVSERLPSFAEGQDLILELKAEQIGDLLYVKVGDYAKRISAGVYSTESAARQRAEFLGDRGFDFSVIERSRGITTTLIDVTTEPDEALQQRLKLLISDPTHYQKVDWMFDEAEPALPVPPLADKEIEEPAPSPVSRPEPVKTKPAPVSTSTASTSTASTSTTREVTVKPLPEVVSRPKEDGLNQLMVNVVIGVVVGALVIGIVAFVYLYRLQRQREAVTVLPFKPDSDQPAQSAESTLADLEQYATSLLKGNPTTSTPLANLTRGAGAVELLDDVLFLVRLESGGEASHNLGFDVSSLIQDIVQQLSNRANEKGISLYFASSESLPELISSDPGKLTRILQGLVGHCIEHTESGRVLIEAEFSSDISMLTLDITHPGSLDNEELFDPEISSNDLPSTHRLRLAVCQRLATVLGGDLSVDISEGDTRFSLDISASEIKPRQFILPDGKTLDQLISSEQSARQLSDERLQALQRAEEEAAKEVERRTQLEAELSTEIGRLKSELEVAQTEAQLEAGKRTDVETSASIHTENLARELEETQARLAAETALRETADKEVGEVRAKLAAEVDALSEQSQKLEAEIQLRVASESDAMSKVEGLEQALSEATASANKEAGLREQAELSARETVTKLQEELQAANAVQAQLGDKEVSRLEEALAQAQSKLDEETRLRSQASDESEEQVRQLLSQLQEARHTAEQESAGKQSLLQQIEQMTQEIERTQEETESLRAALEQSRSSIEETEQVRLAIEEEANNKVHTLEAELEKARQEIEEKVQRLSDVEAELKAKLEQSQASNQAELSAKQALEEEANNRVQALTDELESARELAEREARHREATETAANEQVEALRAQLAEAQQSSIEESTAEIERLQGSLSEAEQKLAQEKQSHEQADGATVDQISNMMDELNQARMVADRERKSREQMEHDSQEMLQAIEQELASAQDELSKEVEQRQRIEEKDQKNQRNLKAALARAKKLTDQQTEYEDRLNEATQELDKAKSDAENFARSEAITREQLTMLQEKLDELESAPGNPMIEQELENVKKEAQNYARAEAIAQEQIAQLKAHLSSLESLPLLEASGPPIVSSLPLNHPVMWAKMKHFMARLFQHLELMETSFNQEQYLDLVIVCNWLKSESQSMGIEAFMEPTHTVELLLRNQEFASIPAKIEELKEIAHRIEFDENAPLLPIELPFAKDSRKAPDTTEIYYDLPANEKKAELLENFISQVGSHLMEMQSDWQEQKVQRLTKNCNWIAKYGTRLKVPELIYAAEDLQEAIDDDDSEEITDKLLDFIDLYTRIKLVHA